MSSARPGTLVVTVPPFSGQVAHAVRDGFQGSALRFDVVGDLARPRATSETRVVRRRLE
jgi:hypothetical protein